MWKTPFWGNKRVGKRNQKKEGDPNPVKGIGDISNFDRAVYEYLSLCDKEINLSYLEDIISAGSNVDYKEKEKTPIVLALEKRFPFQVIDLLVKAGASMTQQTCQGRTPLLWAIFYGADPRVLYRLVKAGSSTNAVDENGWNGLMFASASRYSKNPGRVIRYMAESGISPDSADNAGNTPLMIAARFNQNPVVLRALLHVGASLGQGVEGSPTVIDIARNPDRRFHKEPNPVFVQMLEDFAKDQGPSAVKCCEKYRPILSLRGIEGCHKGKSFNLPPDGLNIGSATEKGQIIVQHPENILVNIKVVPIFDCRAAVMNACSKEPIIPLLKIDHIGGHEVAGDDVIECGDQISPNMGRDLFRLEEKIF